MLENDLLARLPALFHTGDPSVVVGSGPDDCAHVVSPDPRLALSTDAYAENVHFLPEDAPEDVAAKALAASLSDLAASACRPLWALVALCLKTGLAPDWAERFARALADNARLYRTSIIGGDVTSSGGGTVVSVTVVGCPLAGGPLLRSGARPGDAVLVTGSLGGSILGKHLRPTPRLREIAVLMDYCASSGNRPPTAGMDISDGLALDLSRLCRESGVGALLSEDAVPVSDAAGELAARTGATALAHALSDGEDFELLLTMPEASWRAFDRKQPALNLVDPESGNPLFSRIGVITRERDLSLMDAAGVKKPLAPEGYQHRW